ncbi:hypothetical protein PIB30_105456 [Stylosanthes scabra]|uniref:Putative plant transposon protein domain-containing protein n=1 Tax=Stylosanthes scabra TaxID=79078 RepID=A0ABU6VZW1_9FABA|nr:hypothetical protein [Stylosanthes scabra]
MGLSPTSHFNPTITNHPRICAVAYAYAWNTSHNNILITPLITHGHHFPQPPTHMRTTIRICVAIISSILSQFSTTTDSMKSKKVIAECCIDLDEDEYPEVKEQIALRSWRRLAAPKQEISIDLIHEFYANAILTEEEMEEARGHTFRSYVRGKVVDFSLENLRNVMRFRAQVQGAATDFETRKEHDQQLDQVLADLCMPGATWKLSTGQMRVPIQLRR